MSVRKIAVVVTLLAITSGCGSSQGRARSTRSRSFGPGPDVIHGYPTNDPPRLPESERDEQVDRWRDDALEREREQQQMMNMEQQQNQSMDRQDPPPGDCPSCR